MVIFVLVTLFAIGIFIKALLRVVSKEKEHRVKWLAVTVVSGLYLVYVVIGTVMNLCHFSFPERKFAEASLELQSMSKGITQTINFIIPKGKYDVLYTYPGERGQDDSCIINYKVEISQQRLVEETVKIRLGANNFGEGTMGFTDGKFKVANNGLNGTFSAEIIEPSKKNRKIELLLVPANRANGVIGM
jgi:hypothetical protein